MILKPAEPILVRSELEIKEREDAKRELIDLKQEAIDWAKQLSRPK